MPVGYRKTIKMSSQEAFLIYPAGARGSCRLPTRSCPDLDIPTRRYLNGNLGCCYVPMKNHSAFASSVELDLQPFLEGITVAPREVSPVRAMGRGRTADDVEGRARAILGDCRASIMPVDCSKNQHNNLSLCSSDLFIFFQNRRGKHDEVAMCQRPAEERIPGEKRVVIGGRHGGVAIGGRHGSGVVAQGLFDSSKE